MTFSVFSLHQNQSLGYKFRQVAWEVKSRICINYCRLLNQSASQIEHFNLTVIQCFAAEVYEFTITGIRLCPKRKPVNGSLLVH